MDPDRSEQAVAHLDKALSEALAVITQLFLHSAILQTQGHPLGQRYYREWVETMRRSNDLLEGILALGGRPSSREPTRLQLDREPRRILELDVALGERWVAALDEAAAGCASEGEGEAASTVRALLDAEIAALDWRRGEHQKLEEAGATNARPLSVDESLVEALDDVLRAELSAITQTYYHSQLLKTWGAESLAEFPAKETWAKTWRSIDLTDCLLATGGHPAEDGHGQVRIGRDVHEILAFDREYVESQLVALDTALERCDAARNPEIHELLSRVQAGEREHAAWVAAKMDETARDRASEFRG